MTVTELMMWLAQQDGNAQVVACDWDTTEAIRIFSDSGMRELRWTAASFEDD